MFVTCWLVKNEDKMTRERELERRNGVEARPSLMVDKH